MKVIEDPRSPDGQRVLYSGERWQEERRALAELAGFKCEGAPDSCWAYWEAGHHVSLATGEAHHRRGRGAGKRDDRIWIPMPDGTIYRNLLWLCQKAHEAIHRKGKLDSFPTNALG